MSDTGPIHLSRDIEVAQIPSGEVVHLSSGSTVIVTQALGRSYTVYVEGRPGLFRIGGEDGDAIGKEPVVETVVEGDFSEDAIWAQLRECYDPEIPVNIVDLGLIYDVTITDDDSGKGKAVSVKMTLTAPGCGMGPTLAHDAEQRIHTVPGVARAQVELVWDPPWTPERISAAGRERLGME